MALASASPPSAAPAPTAMPRTSSSRATTAAAGWPRRLGACGGGSAWLTQPVMDAEGQRTEWAEKQEDGRPRRRDNSSGPDRDMPQGCPIHALDSNPPAAPTVRQRTE